MKFFAQLLITQNNGHSLKISGYEESTIDSYRFTNIYGPKNNAIQTKTMSRPFFHGKLPIHSDNLKLPYGMENFSLAKLATSVFANSL